ncbi:hypothetical protein IFR05_011501 [Cadophora sp. M221]|nr:hypothetical protein IFR05_011501 [Cadophora sp. M221]
MYHSTMPAAAGRPVTGQDNTRSTKKGHTSSTTLHTSNAGLQVSTAVNDGVPLEPATSSHPFSNTYIHDGVSINTLSIDAGFHLSVPKAEHVDAESEDISTHSPNAETLSPTDSNEFTRHLWPDTDSLSVNAGSYISASETTQIAIGNGDTSPNPAQGISHFSVIDDGSTVHHSTLSQLNTTLHLTESSSHTSDFQLQLWLYETSPTNQTLAEHLEQTNWEDNYSSPTTAPITSLAPHPSGM